jgi:hypothetical protein
MGIARRDLSGELRANTHGKDFNGSDPMAKVLHGQCRS